MGRILWSDVKLPESIEAAVMEEIKKKWSAYYSVNLANYPTEEHELINSTPITINAK